MAVIKQCLCRKTPNGNSNGAEYQDEKHGFGMRSCNPNTTKSKCKCTVCGKEHVMSGSETKKDKKK